MLDYGARMYDPEMARWMSPDPKAESRVDISPYAFCSNNPVSRIDPDGRLDDWYFDEKGNFLGVDNNDSDFVRVMDRTQWDILANGGNTIDAEIGQVASVLFSQADMTDRHALKIYQHFNPTNEELFVYPGNNKGNMHADIRYTVNPETKEAIDLLSTMIGVSIQYNKKTSLFNNAYNIISTFEHEGKHIEDARKDIKKYHKMTKSEREESALKYQIKSPTFDKATPSFRSGTYEYGIQETGGFNFIF